MSSKRDIFHGYDIRGVYGEDIDENFAYGLGMAIGNYFKADKIVIGRDGRNSSPELRDALANGLTHIGVDVYDIGVCTTPMATFALLHEDIDFGVMISASHNGPEYNAFKVFRKVKDKITGVEQLSSASGLKEIQKLFEDQVKDDQKTDEFEEGIERKINILDPYIDYVSEQIDEISGLTLVADYGNGVGAISGGPVFGNQLIEYNPLYAEIDGNFPNHLADNHDQENFNDLIKEVKEKKADLGIFFDGDADRAIAVDEEGEIVTAEQMAGIYMLYHLQEKSGAIFYHDLRFSRSVIEGVREAGGKTTMLPVGNPHYKDKLIHKGGYMGAEWSGHIMFSENGARDDGLYNALKLMEIMMKTKKSLSELTEPFKKYYKPFETNFTLKELIDLEDIKNVLKKKYKTGKHSYLDGVSVDFEDWWFNVRLSNTSPVMRLTIEGPTKSFVEEKIREIKKVIAKYI